MASFKILDIFVHDGQLVAKVEHYKPDNTVWFVEHYTWQGREGLKQKRAVNDLGQLLLDNGAVAPTIPRPSDPRELSYVLPVGRSWARRSGTHMVQESILSVIRSIHQQRLGSGWSESATDPLPTFKPSIDDTLGVSVLLTTFIGLKGRQE